MSTVKTSDQYVASLAISSAIVSLEEPHLPVSF